MYINRPSNSQTNRLKKHELIPLLCRTTSATLMEEPSAQGRAENWRAPIQAPGPGPPFSP